MQLDHLTIKTQEAVQEAQQVAVNQQHQAITPMHLLYGAVTKGGDIMRFLGQQFGFDPRTLLQQAESAVVQQPKVSGGQTYFDSMSGQVFAAADKHKQKTGDQYLTLESLLFGLLTTKSPAADLLQSAGMTTEGFEQAIKKLRNGRTANSASAEDQYQALIKYATHLNERARNGKLDPVIGRDEEIRRVLHILARRSKNNPILIGQPGVGKTAIIEGLAHRIVNGDVPEDLKDKEVFSLDMGALIAGAKYQGEFEERLKAVVDEVVKADGKIFLFIDEIHTLVGAGKSQGAMDAANILKPALARGDLRAIGATTLDEYQKYFEKDKALERRFQTVIVDEPGEEDAISILRGLKDSYEAHHHMHITDGAIVSAVQLSHRYITDRFLPDKAIDLVDEAAAKLRLEMNSMPAELDELERKIRQYEIEREAMKREADQQRLDELARLLSDHTELRDAMRARWESERGLVARIQKAKDDLETLRLEATRLERAGDFSRVAEIRYGRIPELEKEILDAKEQMTTMQEAGGMLAKEQVDADDIAEIVSKWTGIPVTRMLKSDRDKLLQLEHELADRVIGQHEAVSAVAYAIRRSRTGLADEHRPLGSFLFLGTTGVGKTELARSLAEYLFSDEQLMTRIDMSEYQEAHAVSRLIGAPPGYVGYDEGGQLTEAVRRKPYSVILLDEIEKAHPDVFNVLLQVLDDGRLTDSKGRVANFKNAIIIMTSNMGAHQIQANYEAMDGSEDEVYERSKAEVIQLLKQRLRPEFLNRIDEIIMFRPLDKDHIRQIVELQLNFVTDKLIKQDISIGYTDELYDYLAEEGFHPEFGARPLKRLIQRKVLNRLSDAILTGELHGGSSVLLDVFDDAVVLRPVVQPAETS